MRASRREGGLGWSINCGPFPPLTSIPPQFRGMLRCAWSAEAAGDRQGGRLACGGAMGQRPGRTANMYPMLVTCATSQEPMGSLKVP